jgi:magnesium-transporting ATPase (P-type)
VLLMAAVSLLLEEWSDATFIFWVLLINAIIGTVQEHSAERSASALQELVTTNTRVLRQGDAYEIDARELVPGDLVLLEPGDRVPADLRLLDQFGLQLDESLLTGESLAVGKRPGEVLDRDTTLGDRANMAFAGTHVARGRARGIVAATALNTELGRIAQAVEAGPPTKPPLLQRMEQFTFRIALLVGGAVLLMAAVSLLGGTPLQEVFLLAVALAVSAIPEGLPVALTVALAIGMNRMSRRNVIVRRLIAVEALGSCTYIASDKTGTLTLNELTVRRLVLPDASQWQVSGEGIAPDGRIEAFDRARQIPAHKALIDRLAKAVTLANEGFLGHRDGDWTAHGDAVDIALLVMARKAGLKQQALVDAYPPLACLGFESERAYCATVSATASADCEHGCTIASVKGAWERLQPMCMWMAGPDGNLPLDAEAVEAQVEALASQGYRVLAVADGEIRLGPDNELAEEHLVGLTLVGVIGLIDPLRAEVATAVERCRSAGLQVAMVTGDHPSTAFAIARELGMAAHPHQVVTGRQLAEAEQKGVEAVDRLATQARVFARVEPQQKLAIVQALERNGHFVAVTGDGANDAPALREAHVGVAMGKKGTDVARETAELIVTDDNFASIVAGVEEGRVAYANVRKVIFLLISTGGAEIALFTLALVSGLPLPLTAVQLLWLNLVTNGIQDVALAFEKAEGDELARPPRSPGEAIFNRLMVERVLLSALAIGTLAFLIFQWLLATGYSLDEARNGTLLLMVLFENVQVFNSRSETRSAFRHNLLSNPLLLFGTAAAQLVHISAMYTPWLREVLGVQPVGLAHWSQLLGIAMSLLLVMELHKLGWKRLHRGGKTY